MGHKFNELLLCVVISMLLTAIIPVNAGWTAPAGATKIELITGRKNFVSAKNVGDI
jgi:hypothetical protein